MVCRSHKRSKLLFRVHLYTEYWILAQYGIEEANAMTLSTMSADGQPTSRVLLLKGIEEDGFVFYSNYNSRKGKDLQENNKACILFYWENLKRQVSINLIY